MFNQNSSDFDLLNSWFDEMTSPLTHYHEPILDENAVKILKVASDTFKQDIHVFITSIEILEEYIRRKYKKRETNYDEALIISTCLFLSSKYTGEQIDLKVKYISKFLQKLTNNEYDGQVVRAAELDILQTLSGSFPLSTIVDDLNTIIEINMKETRFKANLRPICQEILQLMYICRKQWFAELKGIYSQNEDSLSVFKYLMVNRFYIPVVIMITSLHLTNYKHIVNINSIVNDVMKNTTIHSDHLNILISILMNLIQARS